MFMEPGIDYEENKGDNADDNEKENARACVP
jgi:hypothetical protein